MLKYRAGQLPQHHHQCKDLPPAYFENDPSSILPNRSNNPTRPLPRASPLKCAKVDELRFDLVRPWFAPDHYSWCDPKNGVSPDPSRATGLVVPRSPSTPPSDKDGHTHP